MLKHRVHLRSPVGMCGELVGMRELDVCETLNIVTVKHYEGLLVFSKCS